MAIKRKVVYDIMHKSTVSVLMGITAVGSVFLTYKFINYFFGEFLYLCF